MRIEETKRILQDLRSDVESILVRINDALDTVDRLEGLAMQGGTSVHGLVLGYMKQAGESKTPRDVHADVKLALPHATIDAVTQALYRLHKKGILRQVGSGEYELA